MIQAIDGAKFFMKRGMDTAPNTFDGNMKIQKMLCFADIISLAETGEPLFLDKMYAFKHGTVVENVRLRYKDDYHSLLKDSREFNPDFSEKDYNTLNLTCNIFGHVSAKELSEANHTFEFWRTCYLRSLEGSYHNKEKAEISIDLISKEADKIKKVVEAHRKCYSGSDTQEVINGVKFFIDKTVSKTDELYDELYDFSLEADDSAYTVYREDDGSLVIY